VAGGALAVTVTTRGFARQRHYLTAGDLDGRFDDNFFDLLPGESRTVTFRGHHPHHPAAALRAALGATTIADSY